MKKLALDKNTGNRVASIDPTTNVDQFMTLWFGTEWANRFEIVEVD
jgi:hypothetical protein